MISTLLTLCVENPVFTIGFSPHKGPVMKELDIVLDLSLNKLLNK